MQAKAPSIDGDLPLISVVFVSYNRAHTLVATYEAFLAFTDYPRDKLELILADDASDPSTQSVLAQIPFDKRVIGKKNAGLGANQNRGMEAATGEFIFMLQDDWFLVGRGDYLRVGVETMRQYEDIGFILYRDRSQDNLKVSEIRNRDGHEVSILAKLNQDPKTISVAMGLYSDNPHLKRADFHQFVGPYAEGIPMHLMELEMTRKASVQDHYEIAIIESMDVFKHIGDAFSFNPSHKRAKRLAVLKSFKGGRLAIDLARKVRDYTR